MRTCPPALPHRTAALLLLVPLLFGGCGPKSKAPQTATPAATEEAAPGAIDLSPETLEALVAPIALYPDVVIGHVLLAATNPQEVLDAGNWLLEHNDLSPAQLNAEAGKLGMSTSMRALLAFPETVDMMCMEIDWTTRLGEAFSADQGAVLDAVQRMRAQAVAVGNLPSSDQLKVKTETSEGKSVVLIEPPKPDVIYVPKYDPVAVYAPPPATIPPPTQTVVVEEKSSNDAIVTGLLCFTAGVVIASALHDDYYGYPPHYGYGGIYYGGRPYYPPPPYMYRPPYGGGYYPAHGYHPPPNYNHSFNNNTIIINQGDKNYWNSDFDGGGRGEAGRGSGGRGGGAGVSNTAKLQSPLTKAKPNRPELQQLNREGQDRTSKANASKPAGGRNVAGTTPATAKPATAQAKPAVKGSYAGAEKARSQNVASAKAATGASAAKPAAAARPATAASAGRAGSGSKPAVAGRPTPSASTGAVDRGYAGKSAATAARPEARPASEPAARPAASTASRSAYSGGGGGGALSGAGNGSAERAASQRGRSSMPQGSRTTSGGGSGAGRRSR